MGKRKYEGDQKGTSKKNKSEEVTENADEGEVEKDQPQNEIETEKLKDSSSNQHGFSVKHLRKELALKQGQTMVLTQFLQVCLNPDRPADYLLEYLKAGGNSHEILRQVTQDNKKNLTLATPAFHLFHLIILKVQSTMPHMISVTEEACRYFLNTFMSTVEIMISENSGPRHRKIILKLLTSMVTLNPDLGIEVLNQAPLTPKHLQYILEKPNYKEKDNVRTAFVHFMTSFLVDGHLPLIKALLEKQGLLGLVIPGLTYDEPEAVLMFLNILKKNVIDNAFISKSLKLKTFSHQVLHNLFKIFSWKGPPDLNKELIAESRPEVMSLLSQIILTLCTSHKHGLYFVDNSLGTGDANKNQNLYKALLTLKRPWENEYERQTLLEIIHKCPDLHRAVIHIIEPSFEPQHSPIWERTVDFTIKLLAKLNPEEMVSRMNNLSSLQVTNFIRFMTLPVPLLKLISNNLDKDQTVSIYCIKVLVKMLQSLRRYMQILEVNDSNLDNADLKNKLDYFIPKHLPTPSVIVKLIKEILDTCNKTQTAKTQDYTLPKPSNTEALINLVDVLLLYYDVHPAFFETIEGTIDMKKLLDYSSTLSEDNISVLKFKIVSLWLALDSTAISLTNPMFKDLFMIMLEVYTFDDDDTWIEAKDTLHKFFKNTAIFESDENEIHLVLYTLRNTKINPPSIIGDIVEYVMSKNEELTEYVKNQIIHFEISDQNSEANLDKLFNDLMDNRNTEDSVFLESKIPSPFIVGCIQYMQGNKDLKKKLKQFLSLYVANLLHFNYTPELTEVFIGDSKLDVRSYVASWIGKPVSMSEDIIGKDDVIKNISRTIMDNEEMTLEDIFDCLRQVNLEESDLIVDGVGYKIKVSKSIDSSELLIWAKYLIFCMIRLTNMGLLNEQQQKKIADIFDCIIAIGRKHHMVDVCRIIILSLFKNSHFLKIYKTLNLNKDSSVLPTKFLLDVIKKHEDLVTYLNKKHKIFKSYQQKNFNEIVRAFVKINKRKNVTSDHTVDVMNVIGLTKQDDVKVFNQIFGAEINMCVKDDKEPSIILELLRILIGKYSKSVTFELPQGVLKKTMKMYTDLLTIEGIIPNLTSLEISLTQFLENKPHYASNVDKDIFEKFFKSVTIRKTTSQLASVILKHNLRFAVIFKEQINRPEILSLRELTLPLGSALLNHNQFISENKEFLEKIYNEYKSNIIKFLEKPHKAGQIYIACWQFIRKMVYECMDLKDSTSFFNKTHKFESVDVSHANVFQAVFMKIIVNDNIKMEYIINYYLSYLNLITLAIKENKDVDIVKEIVRNMIIATEIFKEKGIDSSTEEFQKITESAIWQNFCKAVFKDSLKVKTVELDNSRGPLLLSLLTNLSKIFYTIDHSDIVTLFEMVTSHSEFLNVMLSYHSSDVKSRLVEFIHLLITKNKSVMKVQQIPLYLSAYHATRSPCDRLILSVIYYYESSGLPVNEYKPYVFGDSAANYYAVRKNRTSSLWAHPTPNQVLNLFEKDIIDRTVRHFPVTQKLDYNYKLNLNFDKLDCTDNSAVKEVIADMSTDGVLKTYAMKDNEDAINNMITKVKYKEAVDNLRMIDLAIESHVLEDEGIYDPVFVFPLLSHLLAPGSMASCFKLLRIGLLSVPVMALSSHCPGMRAAAYHVLHRFNMLLETETKHKNDKLFLTDFINTLRQSLTTAIIQNGEKNMELKNPRLPAIGALYLAKALMVSTAPMDPLYKPVNNFFIAKQFVDLTVVPDFLSLFHDTEVESAERRLFILDIIRDGTKTMTDVNVVFKSMCLKMIMDFSASTLCDRKAKEKVLEAVGVVVSIPRACDILIEGYSLMSWLHSIVRNIQPNEGVLVKKVLKLIEHVLTSLSVNAFSRNLNTDPNKMVSKKKEGKPLEFTELKINKEIENELSIVIFDLLKYVDVMDKVEMVSYIKVYNLLTRRAIKLLIKTQILNLISKSGSTFKDNEIIKILTKAVVKNDVSLLKSYHLQTDNDLLKVLCNVVKIYLG